MGSVVACNCDFMNNFDKYELMLHNDNKYLSVLNKYLLRSSFLTVGGSLWDVCQDWSKFHSQESQDFCPSEFWHDLWFFSHVSFGSVWRGDFSGVRYLSHNQFFLGEPVFLSLAKYWCWLTRITGGAESEIVKWFKLHEFCTENTNKVRVLKTAVIMTEEEVYFVVEIYPCFIFRGLFICAWTLKRV